MKAYRLKIELKDSNPLIWRRVIMPAGATYNRLHEVIQKVFNFRDYHLFEFELSKVNMVVTNDEEAYLAHQYYKKHRNELEDKVKNAPPQFVLFEEARLERMKKVVRKPTGLKIDSYLEEVGELLYRYDYGDDWKVWITLERIEEDYHYGYPTLLDGAEIAPPEDVGGLYGYKQFLEIYHNPNHPEYEEMRTWAKGQYYREYDPKFINEMLKFSKYKKTEWDQIHKE